MIPVVFVHGIFQMLRDLPAARFLAPRQALIPDMLGYGSESGLPPEPLSLSVQADALATRIREFGHERAHIVGHSVGGAVAMVLALRHPSHVASLIDVEGNFTLADAFWTSKLARMPVSEIGSLLEEYRNDVSGWLRRGRIEPTPDRIAIAARGFHAQSAATVKAMAQAVVETTAQPLYLENVSTVLNSGIPVHLFAGERSRDHWHVPPFVLDRAASMTVQPLVGHMMMLEAPEEFMSLITKLIA